MPAIQMLYFSQPAMLVGLALAALPWLMVWRARRRGRLIPLRSAVLQSLALLALALALARPVLPAGTTRMRPVAVLVDVSASQTGLPETSPFDSPVGLERRDFTFAATIGRPGQTVEKNHTDLAAALSLLAGRAKELSAGVIITDGRATNARAAHHAASALKASGLPVFWLARAPQQADARVADLQVRQTDREEVEIVATVVATAAMQAELVVKRADRPEPLARLTLHLLADQPQTLRWADPLTGNGAASYRAELQAEDLLRGNNVMLAMAPAGSRTGILWACDWPAPAGLAGSTTEVNTILPAALPDAAEQLLQWSAVVVSDANGRTSSPPQRAALSEYVKLGGGLVFAGAGPHGTPADRDDPLNRMLPLLASPFERKPLVVSVLLDASGSMGQTPPATISGTVPSLPKFEIARQATQAMARGQLMPGDFLRVYSFKTGVAERFAGPPDHESLLRLERALAAVETGGGTQITPALEAVLAEPREDQRQRLLIVLSDLQTQDRLDPGVWARRLAEAHIALAVVATGQPDENAPLKRLAEQLNAPFIYRDDLGGLAELFANFLRQARGDVLIRQRAAVRVSAPLFDTQLSALPELDDWVAAVQQEPSELLASTADGQPLIARRPGVVGLAIPMEGPYNRRWRQSADVAKLVSAAVRWVAMPPGDPRFSGQLHRDGPAVRLTLTADENGAPINNLSLVLRLQTADEPVKQVNMLQVAPGGYEGELPAWPTGPAVAAVTQEARVLWRQAFPGRYEEELAGLGVDLPAVQELAALSGGQVVSAEDVPRHIRALQQFKDRLLWPYALALALALALLDWLTTHVFRR